MDLNRHIWHGTKSSVVVFRTLDSKSYQVHRVCFAVNTQTHHTHSYWRMLTIYLCWQKTASEKNKIVKELQNMFEVRVADKVNLFLRSPSGMGAGL